MSEPNTLESMAEMAHKFATDIMVGTDKELMPMFVVQRGGDKKEIEVIGTPFKDDIEKRTMVINVALEIAEKGCDAWSFVTESWFAHRAEGQPLGPRPSEDPNRQEGVICLASDGTETILQSWETKRDARGRCTELTKYDEGKSFDSWIAQALNKAKALHDDFPGTIAEILAEHETLRKEQAN